MPHSSRVAWWSPLAAVLVVALAGTSFAAERAGREATKDTAALSAQIDALINQKLAAEKVTPSPLADDAEFLRRAYLDIAGVIPPADKAVEFLDSKDPSKRAKLIDELLASPRYGRRMTDVWLPLMVRRDADNRRIPFDPLEKWLEEKFNANTPWDAMVTEILTSTGTQEENGAVTFFLANLSADKMTDQVSKLFLGVQLQCAQCHNHPFTKWKQTEYWGMAAFFLKVRPNANPNAAVKNGQSPGIGESNKGRAVRLPESAKMVPAKFFQGEEPKLRDSEPARPVLAKWVTAKDNPFFAKAMVNRVWAQFFGNGFVTPVDDIHDGNPASHPELLKDLATQFTERGFDVKDLIRAICNSQTYQRSSKPVAGNTEADGRLFARMAVKPLLPEQMYDSLAEVIGLGDGAKVKPAKGQQPKRGGPANARQAFVNFFAVDETADPTEYNTGIPQVLRLMNAPQLNNGGVMLRGLARGGDKPEVAIEKIYLATLSRRPTEAEKTRFVKYVEERKSDLAKPYGDILWAILNSSEFATNH